MFCICWSEKVCSLGREIDAKDRLDLIDWWRLEVLLRSTVASIVLSYTNDVNTQATNSGAGAGVGMYRIILIEHGGQVIGLAISQNLGDGTALKLITHAKMRKVLELTKRSDGRVHPRSRATLARQRNALLFVQEKVQAHSFSRQLKATDQ